MSRHAFYVMSFLLLSLLATWFVVLMWFNPSEDVVASFEECEERGYSVWTSGDVVNCQTPDGTLFSTRDDRSGDDPDTDAVAERQPGAYDGCVITGCSSHVCAEDHVDTTCEWVEEYACYQEEALCERGSDGTCGWRETAELAECIATARESSTGI